MATYFFLFRLSSSAYGSSSGLFAPSFLPSEISPVPSGPDSQRYGISTVSEKATLSTVMYACIDSTAQSYASLPTITASATSRTSKRSMELGRVLQSRLGMTPGSTQPSGLSLQIETSRGMVSSVRETSYRQLMVTDVCLF